MKTIKAIGFDYGGVLAGWTGHALGVKIAHELGIDGKTYRKSYFKFKKSVNLGEIDWNEFWKLFLEDLNKSDKLPAVLAINDTFHKHAKTINPDMIALVDRLRTNGYRVGFLSNNTPENAKWFRETGLDKHFDAFDVSTDTGLVKPDPESFQHLTRELEVDIAELAFVDDSVKSLSTAGETGYTPILFKDYATLLDQLAELSIKT